jgi:hypothetical protein
MVCLGLRTGKEVAQIACLLCHPRTWRRLENTMLSREVRDLLSCRSWMVAASQRTLTSSTPVRLRVHTVAIHGLFTSTTGPAGATYCGMLVSALYVDVGTTRARPSLTSVPTLHFVCFLTSLIVKQNNTGSQRVHRLQCQTYS